MRRSVPFSAAGWEAVRFFLLYLIMTIQLNRQMNGETGIFLLWIASIGLLAAAALFMLGRDPERYAPYAPLLLVLKVVQVCFGVLLVLYLRGLIPIVALALGIASEAGRVGSGLDSSSAAISLIVGVDMISALFLSIYTMKYASTSAASPEGGKISKTGEGTTLPKAEFTDVEEEE